MLWKQFIVGRLVVAFDATYVTKTLNQFHVHGMRGMIGGTWWPGEGVNNAWVDLERDVDMGKVAKASTMLEFLSWDPSSRKKLPLSLCSVPLEHNFAGVNSTMRGNAYMLECVGTFMSKNDGLIRALIFDAHGTHVFIRKVLHGQLQGIDSEMLAGMPFFKDLTFEPLPRHCLPRMPIQIVKHNQQCILGIPGVWFLAASLVGKSWKSSFMMLHVVSGFGQETFNFADTCQSPSCWYQHPFCKNLQWEAKKKQQMMIFTWGF